MGSADATLDLACHSRSDVSWGGRTLPAEDTSDSGYTGRTYLHFRCIFLRNSAQVLPRMPDKSNTEQHGSWYRRLITAVRAPEGKAPAQYRRAAFKERDVVQYIGVCAALSDGKSVA